MTSEQIENESAEANAFGTALMQERERTARRCAEIARECTSGCWAEGASNVEALIRAEFGLEENADA